MYKHCIVFVLCVTKKTKENHSLFKTQLEKKKIMFHVLLYHICKLNNCLVFENGP